MRSAYICGLIDLQTVKYRKTNSIKPRRYSSKFFLKNSGNRCEVCKKCFLDTFGETRKFIDIVCDKLYKCPGATPEKDKRGSCSKIKKMLPKETTDGIINHIKSFPAYTSHYSRRHSDKQYLQSDLNLSKMFELYSKEYQNSASIFKYTEIFKSLNLKFKKPSLDACNFCETINQKIKFATSNKEELLKIQEEHHAVADLAYKAKNHDKTLSKQNPEWHRLFTFDLQKCLPSPKLTTNVAFYKRSLWTFNLTIHDGASNQPFNYLWHEGIANRGGNEISSCLYLHLNSLPQPIKTITFYSDNCVGQNKNSFMSAMFLFFLQTKETNITQIDHKFLIVGHTHMECDVVHATIEKQIRKTSIDIHAPHDYSQFIRTIRSTNTFKVIDMQQTDFFNFSEMVKTKYTWRSKDAAGNRFIWSQVRWIRYTNQYGIIQYKNSLDENEPFKIHNIKRRGISRISRTELKLAYNGPNLINSKKKKDILDMLPLISPQYHDFYRNLQTGNDSDDDVDPDLDRFDEIDEE